MPATRLTWGRMNFLAEAGRVYIWNQQWVASIIYTEAERRMIISMKHVLLMVAVVLGLCLPAARADKFAQLHSLLKPQPGESRWMEIDWHPRVWEARSKAAAEGKPLFFMAGSGGAPAAGC